MPDDRIDKTSAPETTSVRWLRGPSHHWPLDASHFHLPGPLSPSFGVAFYRVLVRDVLHFKALFVRDSLLQEGSVLGRVGRWNVFTLCALKLGRLGSILLLDLFQLLSLRQRLQKGRRRLLDRVLLPFRLALRVSFVDFFKGSVDRVKDPLTRGGTVGILQVPRNNGLRLILGTTLLEQVDLSNGRWWQAGKTKTRNNCDNLEKC